jgi:hypothetical protein
MPTDQPQTPATTSDGLDLFRRADGRLALRRTQDGQPLEVPVRVVCSFPWSRRQEFVSVRDDKGKEQALIERLADLPPAARALIEEELTDSGFVPRIRAVDAIEAQAELFHWKVQTDAGPRSFLTPRGDYLRTLPGGGVLIKDVGNDLYLIETPSSLDPKSRKLLWAYLD